MIGNNLSEGFKDTELGPLPEEWEVVRLGDVVQKTRQRDMRKTDIDFKYIDVSSIDRYHLQIISSAKYKGKDAPSRARKIINENDVIIATVRPTLKRIALIPKEYDNQVCSTAFCVLRGNDKINNQFLYFVVQRDHFIEGLGKIQRGASYPAVTDSDIKKQKIPLPPLPEQKKIAAVLSAVQEAKEKTEKVIKAAKELKKSLMKHLFNYGPVSLEEAEKVKLKETDIGMIPEEWEVVILGEVCEIKSGGTPSKQVKEYWENGTIPWIKSEKCNDDIIYHPSGAITELGLKNSSAKILKPNTVLVAMVGATIGKTCFLTFSACTNQNVAGLYPISGQLVNSFYLFYTMQSIYKFFKQIGGYTIANLSFIRSLKIPLPPLPIQQKIAEILSAVDEKIQAEENKKKALEDLFKTLLNNLMTANIRVNELNLSFNQADI